MFNLLLAIAAMGPLGPRPQSLTGAGGAIAYEARIKDALNIDGTRARLEPYFAGCADVRLTSGGYDLVDDSEEKFETPSKPSPTFPEHVILPNPPKAPDGTAAIEHIQATGCGKSYRLNVVAGLEPKTHTPAAGLFIPGYSLARPSTQQQVDMDVTNLAQDDRRATPHPKCDMVALVYDVSVTVPPKAVNAPWQEIWSSYYCDSRQTTEVTYTPSEDGTKLLIDGKLISSK